MKLDFSKYKNTYGQRSPQLQPHSKIKGCLLRAMSAGHTAQEQQTQFHECVAANFEAIETHALTSTTFEKIF